LDLLARGTNVLPQAVNMETLRIALGFFEEQGQIVLRKTKSGRQEAAMTLHPDWVPRYFLRLEFLC